MGFSKQIKIGNKSIAEGQPVFIIAEAGVNHNGDTDLARKLIEISGTVPIISIIYSTYY